MSEFLYPYFDRNCLIEKSELGSIIVHDEEVIKKQNQGFKTAQEARKYAQKLLKNPFLAQSEKDQEILFQVRRGLLEERLNKLAGEKLKVWVDEYCEEGLKLTKEIFDVSKIDEETIKSNLSMGYDTEGAFRWIEHGLFEGINDMMWMLTNDFDPEEGE